MPAVRQLAAVVTALIAAVSVAAAGARHQPVHGAHHPPQAIVPIVRPHPQHHLAVVVTSIGAKVAIDGQVATTELAITLHNPAQGQQEAQVLLPVPDGASVRSLQYDGTGPEPTATLLPRDEARRIYDSIVNRERDPALLEFAGYNLIRTSVFPVPGGATQVVRIGYEQLLPSDAGRVDFVLPRSESLEATGVAWSIEATITADDPIATVYSPSHEIITEWAGDRKVRVGVSAAAANEPGAFRLSYLPKAASRDALAATFMAYPDARPGDGDEAGGAGGGYFLLLAAVPETNGKRTMKREVVLVIDRSGSMRGPKMDQAKAAALQILEGLDEGEAFNIIDYSDSIASFAPRPVIKSPETMVKARAYVAGLEAAGGTNLHDALLEAVRPAPTDGTVPLVLFLTDGLPTVGERSEVRIRDAVKSANAHGRRIFTFGVGFDVNAPLLTTVARASRAAATFVLPEEDVEVKVSQVFRRLEGPVLGAPRLTALTRDGDLSTRLIRELQPGELMDLFLGDQLVVVGRYTTGEPITVRLTGESHGRERVFDFGFDPSRATTRHGFVPRLWASRQIGALLEEVRALGADGTKAASDPRFKELVDEIVRLSTEHGILTEYTAFLATEPTRPAAGGVAAAPVPMEAARDRAADELSRRAMRERTGNWSVAQSVNITVQNEMKNDRAALQYCDADMNMVTITGVQRANDRALFCRGERWVDAALLARETEPPQRTVEFGTPEFSEVVDRLAAEHRQAMLARGGDVYLLLDGERVLVRCP